MRITPLDVRKQDFRKAVRGFDCDEVRAFLTTLAGEYEIVLVDNKQLRERIAVQDEKIGEYQNIENTLRDTLMTAQKVMQDTQANARHEGELIVEDAKQKARQIQQECRRRTEELRREIVMLRKEKEAYLARFRNLAQAQIQFVDTHESDFEDLDKRLIEIADAVGGGIEDSEPVAQMPAAAAPAAAPAAMATAAPVAPPVPTSGPEPAPVAAGPQADAPEVDVWRDYRPATVGTGGNPDTAPAAPAEAVPAAWGPPQVDGQAEPQTESPADAQAEPQAETRADAPVDAQAMAQTEAEAEAKAEAKTADEIVQTIASLEPDRRGEVADPSAVGRAAGLAALGIPVPAVDPFGAPASGPPNPAPPATFAPAPDEVAAPV